ncbi:MAG: diguanylate cyclase [Rhodospirillales bacterium]|nr:diguanylate cyclase [Rhodospirillales bacterium]
MKFLAPLAASILFIVMVLTSGLYGRETESLQQGLIRLQASARDFYEDSIRYDAHALRAVMDALLRNTELSEAFARQDRRELLERSAALFEDIRRDYAITHFYFTKPDRVNLLRVHAPERHGDRIDRFTTMEAERNGTVSQGVELGPLGTFTLRVVAPWYDSKTRQLIGYVELGMEIDRVLQKLRDFFGVNVVVVIRKAFLERGKWEAGMRSLGRTPDWDRFGDVVLSVQSPQAIPPVLAERFARGEYGRTDVALELVRGGFSYRLIHLPLQDARGRPVADMALLADVTLEMDSARRTVLLGSLAALGIGVVLILFFYWQVGRVGGRIDQYEQKLERLASRDGLTGLHNRRMFHALLEAELARAARYKRPVALLMLDIDHFKRINDTYGHQAGDVALKEVGRRLLRLARTVDHVCRYGGEEISIILPETDANGAVNIAERMRSDMAAVPFDIGEGRSITLTVSIGIAIYPVDAAADDSLIAAADGMLYAAKAGGRNRVHVHGQDV